MSVHRERLLSASVQNPLSPRWRRWSSIPAVAVASVLSASTPAHAADGQYIANNTPAFVAAAKSLGAAAESQRIEDPMFSSVLFGLYFGLLVWGGLYLRNGQLRALLAGIRD